MRKQKDISIGGHKLVIEYNDADTLISEIGYHNVFRLLMVRMIPNFKISEMMGDAFFAEHQNYIIREVMQLVQGNKEFYDNFNVNYYFNSGGSQIDPADNALIEMNRNLNITLK
jgi:hypothetical protein